jgi:C4-dicarboxylate-specific signal transduction histidine kinase
MVSGEMPNLRQQLQLQLQQLHVQPPLPHEGVETTLLRRVVHHHHYHHRQLQNSSYRNSSSHQSETSIFLGINITIVIVLLICILGYCYFFRNRFDAIIRHQLELNEQALEQTIRDREMERERTLAAAHQQEQQQSHRHRDRRNQNRNNEDWEGMENMMIHHDPYGDNVREDESTESRYARIVDSFATNKVTMVRHVSCI